MYSRVRWHDRASLLSWRAGVFDGVMLCSCCVSTVQRHAAAAEQRCHASRCCFCCSGLMVLDQHYCAVTCESSVRFDLLWTSSCRRVWFALPHGCMSSIRTRSSFTAPVARPHRRGSRGCGRSVGYVIRKRSSLGSVPRLTCRGTQAKARPCRELQPDRLYSFVVNKGRDEMPLRHSYPQH